MNPPSPNKTVAADDNAPLEKKKKGWFRRLLGDGESTADKTSPTTNQETSAGETLPPKEGKAALCESLDEAPAEKNDNAKPHAPKTRDPLASRSDPKTVAPPQPIAEPIPEETQGLSSESIPIGLSSEDTGGMTNNPCAATEDTATATMELQKSRWVERLKNGLARSSSKLSGGIADLFTKRTLDDAALEDLEDLLIQADLGVKTASTLTQALAKGRFGKNVTPEDIRCALAEDVERLLEPVASPLTITPGHAPHVILVVGVNGAGKTTTIGKMARQFRDQGHKTTLVAGDTFRAAAVEQLKVWGERTGCPVMARDAGADAAGLVFDALKQARERADDVLLVDTAGRLHTKATLMDELGKIRRVIQKIDPDAPHTTLLVLDATVGQNAHQQVKVFADMVEVTGLVMTKLDGTAKGGVVVALAQNFGLPVHFLGVGETPEDLRPFDARDFARSLMGVS